MAEKKPKKQDLKSIKLAKTYTSSVTNELKLKSYIEKNGSKR